MERGGFVRRVARWSVRHRWTAVGLWLGFVTLCLAIGMAMGTREMGPGDDGSGQSGKADKASANANFGQKPKESVLIKQKKGALDQGEARRIVAELRERYRSIPGIGEVSDPIPSQSGQAELLEVTLDTPTGPDAVDGAAGKIVGPMLAATKAVADQHPNLYVEQVGDTSGDQAFEKQFSDDFKKAEFSSVPIALLVLLVGFGALLAAGVPVLLGITAVMGAIGLSMIASHLIPVTDTQSTVILLIGLAVGVDYSLFYVQREREERARGANPRDAVEIAAATSGRAVVVSGLAVMVAMAGMFLSGNAVFISFGMGTILVTACAVIGSITVLPGVLGLLGPWIDRPRIPLLHRLRRADRKSRLWNGVVGIALRRPVISMVLVGGALGALALPALGMKTAFFGPEDMPRSMPIVQTMDRVRAEFPDTGTSHTVVMASTNDQSLDRAAVTKAVDQAVAQARTTGEFALDRNPEVVFSTNGKVAKLNLPIGSHASSDDALLSLERLREDILPTFDQVPHAWAGVTGETAGTKDFNDLLYQRMGLVIGFVLILTLVIMLVAFRSVVIALVSVALNLLSVGAAYGLLVLVFQHSWAESLLDFESNGKIIGWLPLFLFVVLFGLSMDYHVFVVSRIREAVVERGMSTDEGIRHGIVSSASTITTAAAVMVVTFGIFATLSFLDMKQLGVGLAAAILLDATVIRGVLLPATMSALGRLNWYLPPWLRWMPQLAHA